MNDGFVNENILAKYINNHKFNEYNTNIKSFLKFLFDSNLKPALPFKAEQKAGQIKPDIVIKHNGIQKFISIKKGSGNSVHQEKIEVFFPYVESIIGRRELNNLKIFHYGDDSINDTGAIRYNAVECKTRYQKEIRELNNSFNTWAHLTKFLDRFLFIGNISSIAVDAVYHGTISAGLWASREEIIDYIRENNFDVNAVHFGPLSYQVWGRNEKRTAKYPDRRYVMQIKWGNLANDLKNIRERNK
ncbi:hypothetical protein IJG14_08995 [bacterium]|nr:hypothetical protein [bacterium]